MFESWGVKWMYYSSLGMLFDKASKKSILRMLNDKSTKEIYPAHAV